MSIWKRRRPVSVEIIDKVLKEILENDLLYLQWEVPKLLESGFQCVECGKRGNLRAVHDSIDTLKNTVIAVYHDINPYGLTDRETIDAMISSIVKHHAKDDIEGSTFCVNCIEVKIEQDQDRVLQSLIFSRV